MPKGRTVNQRTNNVMAKSF